MSIGSFGVIRWIGGQSQLEPLLESLVKKGYDGLSSDGDYFERALYRGSLRGWLEGESPARRTG